MFKLICVNKEFFLPEDLVLKSKTIQNLIQDLGYGQSNQDIFFDFSLDNPELSLALLTNKVENVHINILLQTFKLATYLEIDETIVLEQIAKFIKNWTEEEIGFIDLIKSLWTKSTPKPELAEYLNDWDLLRILSSVEQDQEYKFFGMFFPGKREDEIYERFYRLISKEKTDDVQLSVKRFIGKLKIFHIYSLRTDLEETYSKTYQLKFNWTIFKMDKFVKRERYSFILYANGSLFINGKTLELTFKQIHTNNLDIYLESTDGDIYKISESGELVPKIWRFHIHKIISAETTLIWGHYLGKPDRLYLMEEDRLTKIKMPEIIGYKILDISRNGPCFAINCININRKFVIYWNVASDQKEIYWDDRTLIHSNFKRIWYLNGHIYGMDQEITVPAYLQIKKIIYLDLSETSGVVFILPETGLLRVNNHNYFIEKNCVAIWPNVYDIELTDNGLVLYSF